MVQQDQVWLGTTPGDCSLPSDRVYILDKRSGPLWSCVNRQTFMLISDKYFRLQEQARSRGSFQVPNSLAHQASAKQARNASRLLPPAQDVSAEKRPGVCFRLNSQAPRGRASSGPISNENHRLAGLTSGQGGDQIDGSDHDGAPFILARVSVLRSISAPAMIKLGRLPGGMIRVKRRIFMSRLWRRKKRPVKAAWIGG
jgi:hypothetical protein